MKQSVYKALYTCLTLGALTALGCGSPLVGLECKDGYTQCGDGCYVLDDDPDHCGGCGVRCGAGEMCVVGECTGQVPDADAEDASADSGEGGEGGEDGGDAGDADVPDGGWPEGGEGGMDADLDGGDDGGGPDDAGPDAWADVELPPLCTGPGSPANCVCELGELICDSTCINANEDPLNCGSCGNDCNAVPPPMGQYFCVGGTCQLTCDPPYLLCGGRCLDSDTDPRNCGSCGNVCESGLCEDGGCLDATAGHVIVIGHDLSSPVNTAAVRRIAENAMFLPPKFNIRGLVYKEFSSGAASAGVEGVINAVTTGGRTFNYVAGPAGASAADVPRLLAQSDVFVIVSQALATNDALIDRGDTWSRALLAFVRRGGVIVLFDGGGSHAGTHQILEQAGLFTASSRTSLLPRTVNVEAPGDAVASLVPMRYQAQVETVGYSVNDGTIVVRDRLSNLPVVIHIAR